MHRRRLGTIPPIGAVDGAPESTTEEGRRRMAGKWKWIVGAIVAVVVAIPVGTFVYINFIEGDPPEELSLSSQTPQPTAAGTATTAAATAPADISGRWAPTPASQVGYRVKEILFGQSAEAVGRTNEVTGTMTVNGTTV